VRVVHVPFGYFPDAVGGTEVYVADLARGLAARGIESVVAAPASGPHGERYQHEGIPVHRFPVAAAADVRELYDEGDRVAAAGLDRVLTDARADVLHLHAFTRAVSLRAARAARRRGIPVVFTYHTPTASCVRGTLLRDGQQACDGELLEQRCTSCLLQSRGVSDPARQVLSRMPIGLGAAVATTGVSAPWVTGLRARELTRARHESFRRLLAEADAVVAVCEWVRGLLLRAGAEQSRLVLSRQGTPVRPHGQATEARRDAARRDEALRLAFVGRLHPTKGIHVVLSALASRRDLAATVDVFGVAQDAEGARYRDELQRMAGGDGRIRFRPPIAASRVVETLAAYDATVVPSQWLETGPLTVLESFAAGVPVIGSNLGGIAELVSHDRDGWLVPHASPASWTAAISRLADDRALVARLRSGVRPPRGTDDVARDMAKVYEAVVPRGSERRVAASAGVV
jgi:glycosyltransferase involved in cell wall biosynthesis